jgi:hypothetical protein
MENPQDLAEVAAHFCRLAGEILSTWTFQKQLSDRWDDTDALRSPRVDHFFEKLNEMLVDSWYMSVARIHDPGISFGKHNLTVNYIVERNDLEESTKTELKTLLEKMAAFVENAKKPRNKLLAHNDLEAVTGTGSLGGFDVGDEVVYLQHLHSFAEIVSQKSCGTPFVFDDLIANDVDAVATLLNRGLASRPD